MRMTLNQLLVELDGFKVRRGRLASAWRVPASQSRPKSRMLSAVAVAHVALTHLLLAMFHPKCSDPSAQNSQP